MGRFTQDVKEAVEFDGDMVCFTLRRLQNKHMLVLAPVLAALPGENALARTARLVGAAEGILRECVTDWLGPKDAAGKVLTFDEVLAESYFLGLMDEVLGRLLKVSVMQEVDAKKLLAMPPAASSGESAVTASSPESLPGGGTALS
jgi:hypothetical protein